MTSEYVRIKNLILAEGYDLSFVLAKDKLMCELNLRYRQKGRPADVLAFPLEKNQGEVFINKNILSKERRKFLFIHALLHLKGYGHGKKMDNEEKRFLKLTKNLKTRTH